LKRNPGETWKIKVLRFRLGNRNNHSAIQARFMKKKKKKPCTDRLFPKMGECREVLGGGPAPPSKL
jgi:hypothetical protein